MENPEAEVSFTLYRGKHTEFVPSSGGRAAPKLLEVGDTLNMTMTRFNNANLGDRFRLTSSVQHIVKSTSVVPVPESEPVEVVEVLSSVASAAAKQARKKAK